LLTQTSTVVTEMSQVGEARRAAVRLAETLGLNEARRSDVAIVTTELATNLVKYARRGQILLQRLRVADATELEIVAVDSGPGMSNVHTCLEDGVSSAGTPGTGLGAIRRLSDMFDAYSAPNVGTAIVSRIKVAEDRALSPRAFDVGAVSIAAPNELLCGDSWRVAARHDEIAVLVADGLGHGPLASEASERAARAFDEDPFGEPAGYFERAHRSLMGSRGAAVSWGRLSQDAFLYAGIGNIAGTLLGGDRPRGLPTQNGTVGVQVRGSLHVNRYDWPACGVLVMHSDGLTTRWSFDTYPGLAMRHPAVVAAVLYRDFVRGRDDATVVVVRRAAQE
jgi:anti-sigma regulatory factor (Ser/Thr protein kinase)